MKKKGIIILVAIVFLVSFLSGCTSEGDKTHNDTSGEWGDAPDFTFTSLQGNTVTLSEFKGKVIVLEFMGVTCPYCVPQLISLEYLRETYSKEDVEIITIDVYSTDTKDVFSALLEAYKCKSPCYLEDVFSFLYIEEFKAQMGKDEGLTLDWIFGMDSDGNIALDYVKDGGVPKVIIVDQNGNIYKTFSGFTEYSIITTYIDKII